MLNNKHIAQYIASGLLTLALFSACSLMSATTVSGKKTAESIAKKSSKDVKAIKSTKKEPAKRASFCNGPPYDGNFDD